jgi:hypothetical protein
MVNKSRVHKRTESALKSIYTLMRTESMSFNEARTTKVLRLEATTRRVRQAALTVKPYLRPAYASCAEVWTAVTNAVRVCTLYEVLSVANNSLGATNDQIQRTPSSQTVQPTH